MPLQIVVSSQQFAIIFNLNLPSRGEVKSKYRFFNIGTVKR